MALPEGIAPSNPLISIEPILAVPGMRDAIRRAGGDIDYISSQLVRLVFFLLFIPVATMTMPWQEVWLAWQTQLIFAFCVVRAAPEVYRKMVAPDTDDGPELQLRPALQPARVNNRR